jgi:hypothetical protein
MQKSTQFHVCVCRFLRSRSKERELAKRKEKGARTREGSIESKSLCKGVVVGASEVLCAASAPLATVVYFVHVN